MRPSTTIFFILSFTLATALAKPKLEDSVRLPQSLIPKKYDIKYTELDLQAQKFKGVTKILILAREPTDKLVLHKGKYLNVTLTYLTANLSNGVEKRNYNYYNESTEMMTYELENELPAGTLVEMQFEFSGRLLDDMHGFYRSSFFVNGKEE